MPLQYWWAPYHHIDIYQLEAVQRRAARFAMKCYDRYQSVTDMLRSLEWPTLVQRRDHSKIIMMYKIVHNIVHIQPDIPLTYPDAVNTRGHHLNMQQPATRIDAYLHSFFPSAVKLWNSLPSNLIDSPFLDNFKCNLAKWNWSCCMLYSIFWVLYSNHNNNMVWYYYKPACIVSSSMVRQQNRLKTLSSCMPANALSK